MVKLSKIFTVFFLEAMLASSSEVVPFQRGTRIASVGRGG
jgi:hypothetical protein